MSKEVLVLFKIPLPRRPIAVKSHHDDTVLIITC